MSPQKIALQAIKETGRADGLNPRTVAALERRGNIRQTAKGWELTKRGESRLAGRLGNEANLARKWEEMARDPRKATQRQPGGGKIRRSRSQKAEDRREYEADLREHGAKLAKAQAAEDQAEARILGPEGAARAVKIARPEGVFTPEDVADFVAAGWEVHPAGTVAAKTGLTLGAIAPHDWALNPTPDLERVLGPQRAARALVLAHPEPVITSDTLHSLRRAGFDVAAAPKRLREPRKASNPPGPEQKLYQALVKAAKRGESPTAADLAERVGESEEATGQRLSSLSRQGLAHPVAGGLFGSGWAPGARQAGLFEAFAAPEPQPLFALNPGKTRALEELDRVVKDHTFSVGAIESPNLGPVSIYWGDDRSGLCHILKRRMEADGMTRAQALDLCRRLVVLVGEVPAEPGKKGNWTAEREGLRAILQPYRFGRRESWLLSGYALGPKKTDAPVEGEPQAGAMQRGDRGLSPRAGSGRKKDTPQNGTRKANPSGQKRTGADTAPSGGRESGSMAKARSKNPIKTSGRGPRPAEAKPARGRHSKAGRRPVTNPETLAETIMESGTPETATVKFSFNPTTPGDVEKVWKLWTGAKPGQVLRVTVDDPTGQLPEHVALLGRVAKFIMANGTLLEFGASGPLLVTDGAASRVWLVHTKVLHFDVRPRLICYLAKKPKFGDRGLVEYIHAFEGPAHARMRGQVGELTGSFRLTPRGIEG